MPDVFDRLKAALSDRYTIERELGAGGIGAPDDTVVHGNGARKPTNG